MAPVFHRLTHEVEEVVGVPTELNRLLLSGEIDVAPISSIEYARHAARLRLMPRLCVSSEGAVDSIQLVSRVPLGRVRSVAVTSESATSVVLTRVLIPRAELLPLEEAATADAQTSDRRRGAQERIRGPDAAPRPRPAVARTDGPADGVRRLGRARAGRRRAARAPGALVASVAARTLGARAARARGERTLRLPGRLPRAVPRSSATASAPRARGPLHLPRDGARRRRARARARAALPPPRRRPPRSHCDDTAGARGLRRAIAPPSIHVRSDVFTCLSGPDVFTRLSGRTCLRAWHRLTRQRDANERTERTIEAPTLTVRAMSPADVAARAWHDGLPAARPADGSLETQRSGALGAPVVDP